MHLLKNESSLLSLLDNKDVWATSWGFHEKKLENHWYEVPGCSRSWGQYPLLWGSSWNTLEHERRPEADTAGGIGCCGNGAVKFHRTLKDILSSKGKKGKWLASTVLILMSHGDHPCAHPKRPPSQVLPQRATRTLSGPHPPSCNPASSSSSSPCLISHFQTHLTPWERSLIPQESCVLTLVSAS